MTRLSRGSAEAASSEALEARGTVAQGLQVLVYDSLELLDSLRTEWLALYSRSGTVTPWAHPDRYCAEVRVAPPGSRPHVVVLRDADEVRGMIIARIARSRLICHLGYWRLRTPPLRILHVVHGGLITDKSDRVCQQAIDHLRTLCVQGHVDVVSVNHLPVDQEHYPALLDAGFVREIAEPHWRLHLVPESYDETVRAFSSKHRREMRRMDRALVERLGGDVTLRRFERLDQVEELIRGCAEVAARTYQAGLHVAFTGSEPWHEILTTEARQGRTRAYWLESRGTPLAFQIGAIYERAYYMDFMGYLPRYAALGVGSVLHARVLADLCADRVAAVDYGFGQSDFKRSYGSESWEEVSLLLYGASSRALVASWMVRSSAAVQRKLLRWTAAAGLQARLKRLWRACLRSEAGTPGVIRSAALAPRRLARGLRKHGLCGAIRLLAGKAFARIFARDALRRHEQREREFDQEYGVSTAGTVHLPALQLRGPHAALGNAYQATAPQLFDEILLDLNITFEEFVFIDFGSGKGRVVLMAGQYPFKKVVGVEFARELHDVALQNVQQHAARRHKCAAVELVCMDAADYPIPPENAVLYFYNPFEEPVMTVILDKIERSLALHPRIIYLVLLDVPYPVMPRDFTPVPVQLRARSCVILCNQVRQSVAPVRSRPGHIQPPDLSA